MHGHTDVKTHDYNFNLQSTNCKQATETTIFYTTVCKSVRLPGDG